MRPSRLIWLAILFLAFVLVTAGCGAPAPVAQPATATPTRRLVIAKAATATSPALPTQPTRAPRGTIWVTPLPTDVQTPGPATPAPAATAAPTSGAASVSVKSATANVRSGPGVGYPAIGAVTQGQQLPVAGRTADAGWWQVTYQGKSGWIAASVTTAPAAPDAVPLVAQLPPMPTAAPAQAVPVAAGSGATPAPAAQPAAPAAAGSGHIAFTRGRGDGSDIALLNVATGQIDTLVDNGRQPDLRFDGMLTFKGSGGGRDAIFTMRADRSYITQVTKHTEDQYPSWPPTTLALAYFTTAPDQDLICNQWDISGPVGDPIMYTEYIPDENGVPRAVAGRYPVWLANDRIAFAGCDSWLQASNCGVWAIDTRKWRDFRPYRLTQDLNDRPSDNFGETLLFSSAASGNWEVNAVRNALPTHKYDPAPTPRNLTNNPANDFGATFSPDGRRIAFMSDRGGWGIWVMNADGSGQRLLAAVPESFGPRWDQERLSWGP